MTGIGSGKGWWTPGMGVRDGQRERVADGWERAADEQWTAGIGGRDGRWGRGEKSLMASLG